MASTDVLTLQEYQQLFAVDPSCVNPARLQAMITGMSEAVEAALNCYFVQRPYTEEFRRYQPTYGFYGLSDEPRYTDDRLVLRKRPIQAVTSIVNERDEAVAVEDYTFQGPDAILYHTQGWPLGVWRVSVVGGHYATTAQVPYQVKMAVGTFVHDVEHEMSQGQLISRPVTSERVGPVSVTYGGMATAVGMVTGGYESWPPMVQLWLAPYYNVGIGSR